MNTPDKCPHCGADEIDRIWESYACGTMIVGGQRSPLCRERTDRIKAETELAATKRELTAIRRRLSGEETESCPLCAEMRGTGESQSVPMCHVCTLESNLEASKQGLEKLKEDLEWAVWNLAGCDVIAMGHSKPFDYAKEHARPALDSVSRMAQRLDAAEARVRELEGLAIGHAVHFARGTLITIHLPRVIDRKSKTLGEAMGGGK